MSPSRERVLRRLNLFDFNIDPVKELQTYRWRGSKRRKSASSAKTPSRELSGAMITQKFRRWRSVESGRRWNGGRVASPMKEHYRGALARVYEFRAARWYPPAFVYAFDFDHRCTRSHLDDWLYCMVRTLDGYHRTSIKGKGACQKDLQSMIGSEGWTILRRLYERSHQMRGVSHDIASERRTCSSDMLCHVGGYWKNPPWEIE
jgi:hypothetical protein